MLDRYAHDPCDLLLIDLYMPGMDGLETILRLKAERPDAKIVAVSGGGFRDKHDVLTLAVKAGASHTLAKPLELDRLLAVVSAALGPVEAEPGEAHNAPSPTGTVLLVDDDQETRSVLRRRLSLAGYAVVEAPPEQALQRFRAAPTDVVITDVILPGTSGAELIARLRSKSPTTGIVAISGAPERLSTANLRPGSGARLRTLAKPFTTARLLDALGDVRSPNPPAAAPRSWLRGLLRLFRPRHP